LAVDVVLNTGLTEVTLETGTTGATGVEVGVAQVDEEWVMVHGQSVIVKVVADLTVYVTPAWVRRVANGQYVVNAVTTSVDQTGRVSLIAGAPHPPMTEALAPATRRAEAMVNCIFADGWI